MGRSIYARHVNMVAVIVHKEILMHPA